MEHDRASVLSRHNQRRTKYNASPPLFCGLGPSLSNAQGRVTATAGTRKNAGELIAYGIATGDVEEQENGQGSENKGVYRALGQSNASMRRREATQGSRRSRRHRVWTRDCVERFNHADAVVVCAFGVGRAFFPPAKWLFGLRGQKTAHTRLSAYAPATQAYRCTQGPPPSPPLFCPLSPINPNSESLVAYTRRIHAPRVFAVCSSSISPCSSSTTVLRQRARLFVWRSMISHTRVALASPILARVLTVLTALLRCPRTLPSPRFVVVRHHRRLYPDLAPSFPAQGRREG